MPEVVHRELAGEAVCLGAEAMVETAAARPDPASAVAELTAGEERFRKVFEYSHDAIFIIDPAADAIVDVNPQACAMLGYTRSELLDMPVSAVHPDDMATLVAFSRRVFESGHGWTDELTCLTRSGRRLPSEISASNLEVEGRACVLAIARDVSERKLAEARIRALNAELLDQATHDPLTGLPNRRLFLDRVGQVLLLARRTRRPFAISILDLDGFKPVNDHYGHQLGDALLTALGPRIRARLRDSDTIARLGGDEFAVLLPALRSAEAAEVVVEAMLNSLRPPFVLNGRRVTVGASAGVACYPRDGRDVPRLLAGADAAMYEAKRTHTGWVRAQPLAPEIRGSKRLARPAIGRKEAPGACCPRPLATASAAGLLCQSETTGTIPGKARKGVHHGG